MADALSRVQAPTAQQILAVSQLQPAWLQIVIDGYQDHTELKELLAALSLKGVVGHFSLKNGVIRYKNRIWLAYNNSAQHTGIQALHASPLGGHSGIHCLVWIEETGSLFCF